MNGRYEKAFQADRDWAEEMIPDVVIADLEGGHSVNVEVPDGFVDEVFRFSDRLGLVG